MAKSKQQKQLEALERKQALFAKKKEEMIDRQPGGNCYVRVLHRDGLVAAEDLKDRANMVFGKYLIEARLNSKGEIVHVDHNGQRHEHIILGKNRGYGGNGIRPEIFAPRMKFDFKNIITKP